MSQRRSWRDAVVTSVGRGVAIERASHRVKRFGTIVDKLTREPGSLASMADVGGVRVAVADQRRADELASDLHGELVVIRTRDWVRRVPPSGYRAIHLHVLAEGRKIEVQVRTRDQDVWANLVENEGTLTGTNLKAGQGPSAVLRFFAALAEEPAALRGERPMSAELAAAFEAARPLLRHSRLRDLRP